MRALKLLKITFGAWMEHNALRLSAALVYYSIFSIAPLLIIAISVAGLVLGPEAVRGHLDEQLKGYIGVKAAESVQSMVQSASKPAHSWIAATVGFVTLLLGASGLFGQLQDALNTIWEVRAKPGTGAWHEPPHCSRRGLP
jgi:membrane protein